MIHYYSQHLYQEFWGIQLFWAVLVQMGWAGLDMTTRCHLFVLDCISVLLWGPFTLHMVSPHLVCWPELFKNWTSGFPHWKWKPLKMSWKLWPDMAESKSTVLDRSQACAALGDRAENLLMMKVYCAYKMEKNGWKPYLDTSGHIPLSLNKYMVFLF